MTKADYAEMVGALRALLAVLSRSAGGSPCLDGANLDYAISVVARNASVGIAPSDLQVCFALATRAGASVAGMVAVYTAAIALAPRGAPARALRAYFAAEAAIQCAAILNAATFTSRDDVDVALAQVGSLFEVVEVAAGNALQTALFRALTRLRAATTANLTATSYPLPRQVRYAVGSTLSALTLAQRLYGDASRAQELAAENKVFHPAFMPLRGRALSA